MYEIKANLLKSPVIIFLCDVQYKFFFFLFLKNICFYFCVSLALDVHV